MFTTSCKKKVVKSAEMDRGQKTSWKAVPLHQIPNGTPLKELQNYQSDSSNTESGISSAPSATFNLISFENKQQPQINCQLHSTLLEKGGAVNVISPKLSEIIDSDSITACTNLHESRIQPCSNPNRFKLIKEAVSESPAKIFQRMKGKVHCIQGNKHSNLQTSQKTTFELKETGQYSDAPLNGHILKTSFTVPSLLDKGHISCRKNHDPVMQLSPAKTFIQMKQNVELNSQCSPLSALKLSQCKVELLHGDQCGETVSTSVSSMPSTYQPANNVNFLQKGLKISTVDSATKNVENWNSLPLKLDTDNDNDGDDERSQGTEQSPANSVSPSIKKNESEIQHMIEFSPTPLQMYTHPDKNMVQTKCANSEDANKDIEGWKELYTILLRTPNINIPRKEAEFVKSKPNNVETPKAKVEKQKINLTKWIVQQVKNTTEICVEGKRDDDGIYWHSNVIDERINQREVKSITGSIYVLKGPLDLVTMKDQGFPGSLLKCFFHGFPLDWRDRIEQLLESKREHHINAGKIKGKGDRIHKLSSTKLLKSQNMISEVEMNVMPNTSHRPAKMGMSKKEHKKSKDENDVKISTVKLMHSDLNITRSGRCIKAPMDYWRGQRLVTDNSLNVTIIDGGTDYMTFNIQKTTKMNNQYGAPITSNQQRKSKMPAQAPNGRKDKNHVLKMERSDNRAKNTNEKSKNQAVKYNLRKQPQKHLPRQATLKTAGSTLNTEVIKNNVEHGRLNPVVVLSPIHCSCALRNQTKRGVLYGLQKIAKEDNTVNATNLSEMEDTSESDIFEFKSNHKSSKTKLNDTYLLRNTTVRSKKSLSSIQNRKNEPRNPTPVKMTDSSNMEDINEKHVSASRAKIGYTQINPSPKSVKKTGSLNSSDDDILKTNEEIKISIKRKLRRKSPKETVNKQNTEPATTQSISVTEAQSEELFVQPTDSHSMMNDILSERTASVKLISPNMKTREIIARKHTLNTKDRTSEHDQIDAAELNDDNLESSASKYHRSSRRKHKNPLNRILSVCETSVMDETDEREIITKGKPKDLARTFKEAATKNTRTADTGYRYRYGQKEQQRQHTYLHSVDDAEAEHWTKKELHRLHRTITALPKYKLGFWEDVAASVGTRSAEECQQKYLSEHQHKLCKKSEVKQKKKYSSNKNKQEEPSKITASIGTLKRKQQVRSFLEHMPKDDHDDLFNDADLQYKRIKLPSFSCDQEESDDVFKLCTSPTTPSSIVFPSAETPQWNHISPRLLEKIDSASNDKYVFQLQKKSKMKNWSKVMKKSKQTGSITPSRIKPSCSTEGLQKSQIAKLFQDRKNLHSDDEKEDEDYYFSNSE